MRRLWGTQLKRSFDVAVVGSGFAGSLMAMIAQRLGLSVILLEKGCHPRVVIGESTTPLANLLLEELAVRYDLPRLKPFTKYGAWQQHYPEVACGIKRGFTFYHHDFDRPAPGPAARESQLLVGSSPSDRAADTHWYRADVDSAFVEEARRIGVEYLDEVQLHGVREFYDRVQIEGTRIGKPVFFEAGFVIDATGPRGFLHRALGLREDRLPHLPQTQALYSHFTNVQRSSAQGAGVNSESPPYSVDNAAVHQIFNGGWVWVLRFNNGVTSAGVAATERTAEQLQLTEGAPAWGRLLQKIPALHSHFARASATMPFTHIPRLSFRSATMAGARWALLPSAAGFVDPLLSTGFPLTLLGISRIAQAIERDWDSDRFPLSLQLYAGQTDEELLATARLIAALYANMGNFPLFTAISLLYFASASFSETVRRLNKPHMAASFLLHGDPVFGPISTQLLHRSMETLSAAGVNRLIEDIHRAITPFDVAGLGDMTRRNWYPVNAEDLYRAAGKLGATSDEISQLLVRSGFSAGSIKSGSSCTETDTCSLGPQ